MVDVQLRQNKLQNDSIFTVFLFLLYTIPQFKTTAYDVLLYFLFYMFERNISIIILRINSTFRRCKYTVHCLIASGNP